jgi:hypothetical protein
VVDNLDSYVYDTTSTATCDLATGRCTHPGSFGAVAGDSCDRSSQCEADGFCASNWPDGYCSKTDCTVSGLGCAGSGVCDSFNFAGGLCMQSCTVGAEAVSDRVGVDGHGAGCRPGYACMWRGVSSTTSNGSCIPGNYNAVAANNVGSSCTDEADCYSPYGLGFCAQWDIGRTCSIYDCDVPGIPADVCGIAAQCVEITTGFSMCLEDCTTANDCLSGYACTDMDGDAGTSKVCVQWCTSSADCRSSEYCSIPSGDSTGTCI